MPFSISYNISLLYTATLMFLWYLLCCKNFSVHFLFSGASKAIRDNLQLLHILDNLQLCHGRSPLHSYVEVPHVAGYPELSDPYMFEMPIQTPGHNYSTLQSHSNYLSFAPPEVSRECHIFCQICVDFFFVTLLCHASSPIYHTASPKPSQRRVVR